MQTDAQFNALHLLVVMVKLVPEWLPEEIFEVLHRRWKGPERRARFDFRLAPFSPRLLIAATYFETVDGLGH